MSIDWLPEPDPGPDAFELSDLGLPPALFTRGCGHTNRDEFAPCCRAAAREILGERVAGAA